MRTDKTSSRNLTSARLLTSTKSFLTGALTRCPYRDSRADELFRMLDEGVEPAEEEPVPSSVAAVESQTVAPDVIMPEAQANHLRIGPGNRLYMESGPRQ